MKLYRYFYDSNFKTKHCVVNVLSMPLFYVGYAVGLL